MDERDLLAALLDSLDRREAVALVTATSGSGVFAACSGRRLLVWPDPRRAVLGDLNAAGLTMQLLAGARQAILERKHRQLHYAADQGTLTVFVEVQAQPPHLVIVGAGHIAVPMAAMAHLCDFEITVLDDRPQYANRQRFPTAGRVVAGPLRAELRRLRGDQPAFDPHTYFVLVTRGHQYDVECLLEVLDDPVAYIGMIGSRRRIRAVFDLLEHEQGIAAPKLERIYAPVGLAIGAQTPAEIAVSIMAEIINVQRSGPGLSLSAQIRRERAERSRRALKG